MATCIDNKGGMEEENKGEPMLYYKTIEITMNITVNELKEILKDLKFPSLKGGI